MSAIIAITSSCLLNQTSPYCQQTIPSNRQTTTNSTVDLNEALHLNSYPGLGLHYPAPASIPVHMDQSQNCQHPETSQLRDGWSRLFITFITSYPQPYRYPTTKSSGTLPQLSKRRLKIEDWPARVSDGSFNCCCSSPHWFLNLRPAPESRVCALRKRFTSVFLPRSSLLLWHLLLNVTATYVDPSQIFHQEFRNVNTCDSPWTIFLPISLLSISSVFRRSSANTEFDWNRSRVIAFHNLTYLGSRREKCRVS